MTIFPIVVTGDWAPPDGSVGTGSVQFDLSGEVIDATDGLILPPRSRRAYLDQFGKIAVPLAPNDPTALKPPNSQYFVQIEVDGASLQTAWITVPSAPSGSRTVTDAVTSSSAATGQITSATASFVSGDVGKYVAGTNLLPLCQIVAVVSSTTITVNLTPTASGSGGTLIIGASADLSSLIKV